MGQGYYPPVADSKVLATPATRRMAREMNVDINQLKGSGLAGRVTQEDVMAKGGSGSGLDTYTPATMRSPVSAPALPRLSAELEERIPMRGVRKKIAENMQMSKHIIPHFTLMDEANVTELVSLRDSLKDYAEKHQTKITYLPFVMKALIATCKQFPMVNASIDDAASEIVYKNYFNIGFAADTPNGLMVPVIKDADRKTVVDISREILDLAKRARDGKLKLEEMKGATVTVTNIGSVGGTYATPIINHPEVAIFGMYKIQDKLSLSADGKVTSQKFMNFTITADHRLIDGAVAANFLKAFISKLEKPGMLMMEMI
jgi:pyruvate dehydrogenase E2 component (dihydrolipoamide acetyltransferase)